jgi:hypothetical protein
MRYSDLFQELEEHDPDESRVVTASRDGTAIVTHFERRASGGGEPSPEQTEKRPLVPVHP